MGAAARLALPQRPSHVIGRVLDSPDHEHLLARALGGDSRAGDALVELLLPVIHARVARALVRSPRRAGRAWRQEVEDRVQEVLVFLFEQDARVLRSWDQARGLSLRNFVGLVADRQMASVLRSGKQSPWTEDPTLSEALDALVEPQSPEPEILAKSRVEALLRELESRLSPVGKSLFLRLVVEERPIEEVASSTGMKPPALYQWRSRLLKLARAILSDVDGSGGGTGA
jgi:RNA polymerase sigma-70 factor (ECF subfamily)